VPSPAASPSRAPDTGFTFVNALPRPSEVSNDLFTLFVALGVTAVMLLLIAFPSSLFEETLEENHDEIFSWFMRAGGVVGLVRVASTTFWRSPPGVLLFMLVSAIVYGFLEPSFGLDVQSLALVVGVAVGLALTTATFEYPITQFQRRANAERGYIRVLPVSIVIAIACVAASRLAGFEPGYIYGVVAFWAFTRGMSLRAEGSSVAVTSMFILLVALIAWLSLPLADGLLTPGTLLHTVVAAVLTTVFVGGLQGLLIELLPLRFLRGATLWQWSRGLWVIVFLIAAFAFVHILVVPNIDFMFESGGAGLITALGFLLAFTLFSIAFWAYFRHRSSLRDEPQPLRQHR
jgi:hypothetical protein